VTEKYGPSENRQKAIEQLGEMGTPEALLGLCERFTVLSDPGITDGEEKERALRILIDAGAAAVDPVREFVRREESGVSWGLRALAEIESAAKVNDFVLAELARLSREYSRDPDKKLVLLTWLVEHRGELPAEPVQAALLPLLEDFSDDVRIAALRALTALAPGEPVRDALIELLLRDTDNARVRGDVLEALARMGADVKGHRPSVEPLLVDPFYLDREGNVKKRG
jgi:HEAT repeat protein